MSSILRVLSLLFLIFSLPLHAEEVPTDIDGARTLDAEALIELAQVEPELIVIDSRIRADRRLGYIEDSVNLPDLDTNCTSLHRISADKAQPIAFYCNGARCLRSTHAISKAVDCGYRNLFWLRGGFEEWRNKDYPYLRD